MKPIDFISGKWATVIAVALLSVASLAGCGSDNNIGDDHPPPEPTPTPVIDAFYAIVAALTANSPDDTEAVSIEATVVTAPEDTEPQPLG
ncbi:hypothetical protein [Janthinobacterium sp. HLX7-2]|uniref:hypothetical protein n=1 Tax=Janthinobacterium sp. HLX7-2 TaxID=1259331 RepID=UPI003F249D16